MDRLTRQDLLDECRRYISDVRGAFTDDEQLALAEGFRDLALSALSQEAVRDEALEGSLLSLLKQGHAGDFHVSITGNGHLVARKVDGWVLAEMSLVDNVVNGSTDGTPLGRSAWNFMLGAFHQNALKREPNATAESYESAHPKALDEPAPAAPDVASMVKLLRERAKFLDDIGHEGAVNDAIIMAQAAALLARIGQGRYSAPFKMVGGKEEWVQIRFVSRAHIHDRPTEANPSPIRVILMHELERAQPAAMAQPVLGASDD